MENKDILITLKYNLDEINGLLTLLGQLPYAQSVPFIDNIRIQATSQLPEVKSGGEVDTEGNSEAGGAS
jgi:hypothetical protein